MALRFTSQILRPLRLTGFGVRSMSSGSSQMGDAGSGAGKGGGTGGAIRDAGGSFGKMEVSNEERFFKEQREAQMKELREHMLQEKKFIEGEIAKHQEAINRHKDRIEDLEDDTLDGSGSSSSDSD